MVGRKTREKVFRIRYRDDFGFRSRLVIGNNPQRARIPGRVLKVSKVSPEELYHVGSSNQLPKLLMKEFRGGEKKPVDVKQSFLPVKKELRYLRLQKSKQEVVNVREKETSRDSLCSGGE